MAIIRPGLAVIAWLFLLVACANEDGSDSDASADAESEQEDEVPAIPVEAEIPDRGTVFAMYSGTAPIEALQEATVIAKVPGEIVGLTVEEGDEVSAGQVLATLDGDRLALELSQSKARLEKLKKDHSRNIELRNRGLISEGDFDTLKYEMEALQATYNLARLELDYTRIRAPIAGVISERVARLGNTVEIGAQLFRITSFDPLVAYLHVPEREYRRITPGKPVGIQIDALGETPVIASVTRVSPVVDPETGTFKITVEIRGEGQRIKPGMFARISVIYEERENALRIPRGALIDDDNESFVFVIEDGVAKRRQVETGFSNQGLVEIRSGLDESDQVVTVGQVGLKDGAEVRVIGAPDEAMNQEGEDNAQAD